MWLSLSYQLNQGPYNVSVSEGSLFKLGEMPPQPYFKGRASCYSDRLCDISFKCVSCQYIGISMSTVPFLILLGLGILCLQNAPWLMI